MPRIGVTLGLPLLLLLVPSGAWAQDTETGEKLASRSYSVLYDVRLAPTQRAAHVKIVLGAGAKDVRFLRFEIDPERHHEFSGEGTLELGPDWVLWKPTDAGATLRYRFQIDHLRNQRSFDARCGEDWAVFRGDDLIPPVRARTVRGATSRARLRFRLPEGWTVATPYRRTRNGSFEIEHPERGFDRPTGWIAAGRLGVLRERIAGVRVGVAAPTGHGMRRLDILALLRWTLPNLRDILPDLPDRILIVGAGDPMWRGGLSGPYSIFVHADRPLIVSDGTSPLLHELMHTVLRSRAGTDGDWIVEGLAELYSLELLRRSRSLSRRRYERSLDRIEERGRKVESLRVAHSSGAVTARAVTVLRALDSELRSDPNRAVSLDDVVRDLARGREPITTDGFRKIVEAVAGRSLEPFFERYVPKLGGS